MEVLREGILWFTIYLVLIHISALILGMYLQEKITKLSILRKAQKQGDQCDIYSYQCDACCDEPLPVAQPELPENL